MTADRTTTRRRARGAGAVALAAAAALTAAPAVAATAPAATTATYALTPTPALAENPLKGFLPFAPEPGAPWDFADPDFPHSMEWFYLPVDAVVTAEDTYDWTAVEDRLDAIAERGHQSVFRFYLDYPGQDSGVPEYLLGADGISQERTYDFFGNDGRSFSPDYDDPRVVDLLVDFITAFGDRYDGDPRVGYVTAGLIGFWGEHHTYPMEGVVSAENPTGANWMPSQATQDTIWDAWDTALDETWLLARYPSEAVRDHGFGLHDDSFAYATLPTTDWHFLARVNAAGMQDAWRQAPIGGELYPPLQTCLFDDPLSCPGAADEIAQGRDFNFADSVSQSHISWMMNHQAWATGYTGATRERAVAAAASLGYDLTATTATVTNTGTGVEIAVELTNRGVAPFYGDWPATVAVLDEAGAVLAQTSVDADLPALLPGGTTTITATVAAGEGTGDLGGAVAAVSVPNVMDGGVPLRFANVTQDAHLDGFLTLGAVPAAPGTGTPDDPAVLELASATVAQGGTLAVTARNLVAGQVTFGLAGSTQTLATAPVVEGVAQATLTIPTTTPVGPVQVEVRDGATVLASTALTVVAAPAPTPTATGQGNAPVVLTASSAGPRAGGLADTGASVALLVWAGVGAAAGGAGLLAWRRRVAAAV